MLTAGLQVYPVKSDDWMPYASGAHSYWTGYYSSRPSLKLQDTTPDTLGSRGERGFLPNIHVRVLWLNLVFSLPAMLTVASGEGGRTRGAGHPSAGGGASSVLEIIVITCVIPQNILVYSQQA